MNAFKSRNQKTCRHCVADVNANTPLELSYEVPKHRPMGFIEFVVVIAAIIALNPLAMDIMLPALPNIGSTFHVEALNRLQMVLTAFLIGFGAGQFVIGPLSDSFGRRAVLLGGMILYAIASVLAMAAPALRRCCWRARWRGSAHRRPDKTTGG